MTMDTSQFIGAQNKQESIKIRTAVRANLITRYNFNEEVFEVIVDYQEIDLNSNNQQPSTTNIQTNSTTSFPDQSKQIDFTCYATIEEYTGEILVLQTSMDNNNKLLHQVTIEFLESVFPRIEESLYMLKLQAGEDDGEENQSEKVVQGEVVAHYQKSEQEDENGKKVEVQSKTYSTEDFIDIITIGEDIPEINFSRTAYVDPDTKITQRSVRHKDISFKKPQNLVLQAVNDGTVYNEDLIAEIRVTIDEELQLQESSYDKDYVESLSEYDESQFQKLDLKPSNEMKINDLSGQKPDYVYTDFDEHEQSLLQQSSPVFSNYKDIVSHTFLGFTVALQAQYHNISSNIQAHMTLNGKSVYTIYDNTYKHPSASALIEKIPNLERETRKRIITWPVPILAIITIDLSVDIIVLYGIKYSFSTSQLAITPYFRPGIEGSASSSLYIVKGGVKLRGTICNTELALIIKLNPSYTTKGQFTINVSVKQIAKKVYSWFRWFLSYETEKVEICSWSSQKEVTIVSKNEDSYARSYQIFEKIW